MLKSNFNTQEKLVLEIAGVFHHMHTYNWTNYKKTIEQITKKQQSWYVWKSEKYLQKADHLIQNNQKQFIMKKNSFDKIGLLML